MMSLQYGNYARCTLHGMSVKNRRHGRKHKISFKVAKLADEWALSLRDRVMEGEEQWQTRG